MLKLKLKNFRRFLDTDWIEIQPGLTIITGPNGAGKSTLVESLSYALFGPKKGPGNGGVRSDNAIGDVEVLCTLRVDGHEVQIHRKGGVAELRLDGTVQVASQPKSVGEVNRNISRLLGGLSRKQFEQIHIAEQGQTAGLVEESSTSRHALLTVALQLDVLEEACRQQDKESDGLLGSIKARADNAVDALGLSAEERAALDELKRAKNAGKRLEHLEVFLARAKQGLGALDGAADTTTKARKNAEQAMSSGQLARDEQGNVVDRTGKQLKAQEERSRTFDSFREPIAKRQTLLQAAKDASTKKQREIDEARSCADSARAQQEAQEELAEVRARLGRLPLVKERWRALAQADNDLRKNEAAIADLGDPEKMLKDASRQEIDAEKLLEALEADPTAEERETLQRRKGEVDAKAKEVRTSLTTLEDAGREANCPTCGQPLEARARELRIGHLHEWLDKELPSLLRELKAAQQSLDERQNAWRRARQQAGSARTMAANAVRAASTLVERRRALLNQRDDLNAKRSLAQRAWDELREAGDWDPTEETRFKAQEAQLNQGILDLKAKAELHAGLPRLEEELQGQIDAAREAGHNLARLRADQAAIGYDAEAHRRAKDTVAEAQAVLDELDRKLNEAKIFLLQCEADERRALGTRRRGAEALGKLEDETATYVRVEQLLGVLETFKGFYFQANTSEISRRTTQLLAQAVSDGSILGIEFGTGGDLFYRDASHARQPMSRLSGGEKALVGLCLRIAVAEQALRIARTGKLDFLVLDEVLSSLDDERREAMQRVFDDVQRRGLFEHIVMITHLESVKHGWAANNLRVEKIGSTSRVVADALGRADADGSAILPDEAEAEVVHA